MNVKELINFKNIRALLVVFFNLSGEDEKYFYVKSEYRESIFLPNATKKFNYIKLNNQMRKYFGLPFESDGFGKHILRIKKNIKINNADIFLSEIYRQIQLLGFNISSSDYEEAIIMGLFVLRGSPDFTGQYYAVDIYREFSTKKYLKNIFQLLSGTVAISQFNLNFREFQPQYTAGTNYRNTQIRIKLVWIWEKYGLKLKDINSYKFSVLNKNKNKIAGRLSTTGNFLDRLIEYMQNVLGEEIGKEKVQQERKRLGIVANSSIDVRDYNLKNIVNNIFPDECMGCKDIFEKKIRTFKLRNRDQYYFEIHHVIPFSVGKEHDQIDNLAKLCPVCHRILTRNRAEEYLQKETIQNILNNSENVKKYVSILVGTSDMSLLTNFVYQKLS